jgi:hypothetical protein
MWLYTRLKQEIYSLKNKKYITKPLTKELRWNFRGNLILLNLLILFHILGVEINHKNIKKNKNQLLGFYKLLHDMMTKIMKWALYFPKK